MAAEAMLGTCALILPRVFLDKSFLRLVARVCEAVGTCVFSSTAHVWSGRIKCLSRGWECVCVCVCVCLCVCVCCVCVCACLFVCMCACARPCVCVCAYV